MARPDFVYFDLGNVLVHFDHQRSVRNLAKLTGVSEEKARAIVFDSGLEDRYETGLLTSEQFVAEISREVGKPLEVDQVLQQVSDMFWVNESILPILESVARKGIRMGLLSNTCEAHWKWIEGQGYETVVGWFEQHVLSYEVRSMKPSRAIYDEAAKLVSVKPESIFFIDDRIENVQGARSAGWQSVQFHDSGSLANIMEEWK